MNKRSDYQVSGVKANGDVFTLIVRASYGYEATKKAKAIVGSVKVIGAMKVDNFDTAECASCGIDVPQPYQVTHACVSI